jgi:predicted phosphoadenosine phosphosulfate sulfurtransferase
MKITGYLQVLAALPARKEKGFHCPQPTWVPWRKKKKKRALVRTGTPVIQPVGLVTIMTASAATPFNQVQPAFIHCSELSKPSTYFTVIIRPDQSN